MSAFRIAQLQQYGPDL